MNCIRMELNEKMTDQREMVWSGKERERDGGQMQVADDSCPIGVSADSCPAGAP